MSRFDNLNTKEQDSFDLDAFNRKRVSSNGNRYDVEFIYDKNPLLIDEVLSGGATSTFNSSSRDITLDVVNATDATSGALYSHTNIPYTPGNSQLVELTGVLDDSDIGGGVAQIFHRSKVTGTVVETPYDQVDWNKDAVSTVDWTKSQIFAIDFQSLKVGRIRFALVRNGLATIVHEVLNDNIRDSGYWQSPSLPIYWRIYNDATYTYMEVGYGDEDNAIGFRYRIAVNASATMRAICGTVKSEGGETLLEMPGFPFSADNEVTKIVVGTTLIPVLSIRPKATFQSIVNRILSIPTDFNIEADNPVHYELLYQPTLTNASWVDVDTANSGMEFDVSATAVSGGIQVGSGYISTRKNAPAGAQGLLGRTIMALGRTGTSDILTIACVRTGGTNANVLSNLNWKDIR